MTRKIKFRGKTINGEWVKGAYFAMRHDDERKHTHHFIIPDGTPIPKDKQIGDIQVEVRDFTIGQFTGLHDKNGKEIYEGDIIAVNGMQIGYIVGGVRGYCYDVIYTPEKSNGEKAWPLYSVVTRDYPNKCEVIGNIYDNPELLK